ncbi:MAG: hypothetical protein LBI48_12480 [Burkholderiaceae bacterium]|jgi:hypothetical protein|nr:hypothetical protein [Burkholderiaceae bacterium]
MSEPSSPIPPKPQTDMRRLSLAQLQELAKRGSRRARIELEARMGAPLSSLSSPAPLPPQARAVPAAPPMPRRGALAAMDRAPPPLPATASDAEDPRIRKLEMTARQDREDAQSRGLPQLFGLLLMGWGGLLVFAGLVMLAHRGGGYYLAMGVATLAVGWLLLKGKIWAIYLQSASALLALAWAWSMNHSIGGMLVQAAAVWVIACWMVVPPVREPLD